MSSDLVLFLHAFVGSLDQDIKSYLRILGRENSFIVLCELHRLELTVSQGIRAYASTHIDQAAQLSYEIALAQ